MRELVKISLRAPVSLIVFLRIFAPYWNTTLETFPCTFIRPYSIYLWIRHTVFVQLEDRNYFYRLSFAAKNRMKSNSADSIKRRILQRIQKTTVFL